MVHPTQSLHFGDIKRQYKTNKVTMLGLKRARVIPCIIYAKVKFSEKLKKIFLGVQIDSGYIQQITKKLFRFTITTLETYIIKPSFVWYVYITLYTQVFVA